MKLRKGKSRCRSVCQCSQVIIKTEELPPLIGRLITFWIADGLLATRFRLAKTISGLVDGTGNPL